MPGIRTQVGILATLSLGFVLLYAGLYPPTYSIIDEQGYISYGLVLAEGTLFSDVAGVRAARSEHGADGHLVPEFGYGTSALLAPFVTIDWRASFAVIGIVHLLGSWLCVLALRRCGLPPIYAVLYLLHPVGVLYSRTAMADVPSATLMMAAVAAWAGDRKNPWLTGLVLGLAPHFRVALVVPVAAFGAVVLIRDVVASRREGRVDLGCTLRVALGLLPGVASWLALNTVAYGGPFDVPVVYPLSLAYVSENLPRYLLSQNLIYPGMLLVALLFPSRLRLEAGFVAVATIALYCTYRFLYTGFGPLSAIVIGDRFFLPLFPFLVIPYVAAIDTAILRIPRWRPLLLGLGVAVLAIAATGISVAHQHRLENQAELQGLIYDSTPHEAVIIVPDMTAYEHFFDPLGVRFPVLGTWLDLEPAPSPYMELVEASLPDVFLLLVDRLDRPPRERGAKLLQSLQEKFELRLVADRVTPPDRLRLFRLQSRHPR